MSERYQFDEHDQALLQAAKGLLKKVAAAKTLRPAELVSVAKLQHVLSVLPKTTVGVDVTVSVTSPRRKLEEVETFHCWEVGSEEGRLSISGSGHFWRRHRHFMVDIKDQPVILAESNKCFRQVFRIGCFYLQSG